MNKNYPEDYNGPRSGESTTEEWAEVREYDAFKYTRFEVWTSADFDNYIYAVRQKAMETGLKQSSGEYATMLSQIGAYIEEFLPSEESTVLEGVLVLLSRYLALKHAEVEDALDKTINERLHLFTYKQEIK